MERGFSIKEELVWGWNALRANLSILMMIFIAFIIIHGILGYLAALASMKQIALSFAIGLVQYIVSAILTMGLIKIALKICDDRIPDVGDLFSSYPLVVNYIIASIVYGLMVIVGFIFLIVPGIYLAIKHQFYTYLIVDKGMGPIEAIKESGRITEGVKWNLLGFVVVVALLGAAVWIIGLGLMMALGIESSGSTGAWIVIALIVMALIVYFLALSLTAWLAIAHIYRTLERQLTDLPEAAASQAD